MRLPPSLRIVLVDTALAGFAATPDLRGIPIPLSRCRVSFALQLPDKLWPWERQVSALILKGTSDKAKRAPLGLGSLWRLQSFCATLGRLRSLRMMHSKIISSPLLQKQGRPRPADFNPKTGTPAWIGRLRSRALALLTLRYQNSAVLLPKMRVGMCQTRGTPKRWLFFWIPFKPIQTRVPSKKKHAPTCFSE